MSLPKGIMLYSEHYHPVIPKGVDFIVAVALSDGKAENGFKDHVQEAYDANVPCVALVQIDPTPYLALFGLAAQAWPAPENDPHIKILDTLFFAPGKKSLYAIHGVILDVRNIKDGVTPDWMAATAQHLAAVISARYFGITVYVLTDYSVMQRYPDASFNPQVYLSTVPRLCTYDPVDTFDIPAGDMIPSPGTNEKPIPNWNGIKFWWFSSLAFTFLDGKKAPVLQYRAGNLNILYHELNFTPRAIDETEEIPTEETTPTGSDYEAQVLSRLDTIIELLDKMKG